VFVFGHAGLTIAAARRADPGVDARWAAALALGPDLIDKPLSRLFPALVHHNTRNFGHTLLFSLFVFAALLVWKRRPKAALLLWACYAGHLFLDAMWTKGNHAILFWPLLGDFPAPVHGHHFSWLTVWYAAGELAGLAIVVRLVRREKLLKRFR
jgi:inner membrane protein